MLHPRHDYNERVQDAAEIIPADEPVFLLRAQDSVAPAAVRYWAQMYLRAGGDADVALSAMQHALRMEAWPVMKLADAPSAELVVNPDVVVPLAVDSDGLPVAEQPPESPLEQLLEARAQALYYDSFKGTRVSVEWSETTEETREDFRRKAAANPNM